MGEGGEDVRGGGEGRAREGRAGRERGWEGGIQRGGGGRMGRGREGRGGEGGGGGGWGRRNREVMEAGMWSKSTTDPADPAVSMGWT